MADHDHTDPPSDPALRVKALESLLVEKGLIDPNVVGEFADYYEHRVGPRNGAKVVARAWVDPAYRERLLADGTAAIAELQFGWTPDPADRAIFAPPPGRSSIACTTVPVGMFRSGRQLPGRMSEPGPFSTRSPCCSPCGARM
jgi:nitrile hydratase